MERHLAVDVDKSWLMYGCDYQGLADACGTQSFSTCHGNFDDHTADVVAKSVNSGRS